MATFDIARDSCSRLVMRQVRRFASSALAGRSACLRVAKEGPQPDRDGAQYWREDRCYDANVVLLLLGGELLKGALNEVGDNEQKSSANGSNRHPKRDSK